MTQLLTISGLLLGLLLAAGPAYAQGRRPVPALAQPGKVLFAQNCARCHGPNGKLGRNGAHDLTKSNLNAFGRSYLVANGLGKMPAFAKQLSDRQIQDVVAYSLTLR